MGREGGSEGWRWHVAQKEDEKDWLSRLTDQHTAVGRAARGLACGADEKDRKEVRGGGVCRTTIDYSTMISHALRRATIVRGGECSQSECSHAATRARNTCRRSRALEQGSDDAASALNQRSHGALDRRASLWVGVQGGAARARGSTSDPSVALLHPCHAGVMATEQREDYGGWAIWGLGPAPWCLCCSRPSRPGPVTEFISNPGQRYMQQPAPHPAQENKGSISLVRC